MAPERSGALDARVLALSAIVIAGVLVCGCAAWFMLQDWAVLRAEYAHFESLVRSGADLRAISVANDEQNVFRLNCFAEGVGALLGALLAAVGVHGLCLLPRPTTRAGVLQE
ncbi:MAG: hypothetical protein LC772_08260 [Chloroflexi bacterium]|nr:hypothetical protein [Chloroflexota bacterium]